MIAETALDKGCGVACIGARHIWLVACVVLVFSPTAGAYDSTLQVLSDSVRSLKIDLGRQAKVGHIEMERAGARFILEEGTLTLPNTVTGRVFGATFSGKGRFYLDPPNRAEEYMLVRHTQDTTADWTFDDVAFLFSDSTARELTSKLAFGPVDKGGRRQQPIEDFIEYIEDDMDMSVPALLLCDILDNASSGRFMARFTTTRGKMIFVYDPREIEEVQLYKENRSGAGGYPDLVQSFHISDQYADSRWGPSHENKDLIDSLNYDIECTIHTSDKTELDVRIEFLVSKDSVRSLFFQLMPEIKYNSLRIMDGSGDSLLWLRLEDEYGVTVFFDEPLRLGERVRLRFEYNSTRMVNLTPFGGHIIVYATTWYPRYGYLKRARHRMTFSVPKQHEFVAVGRKVSESIEGDVKISTWDASDYPVAFISYNYGQFNVDTSRILGDIPVSVYSGRGHRTASAPMREVVLLDIVASASLFSAEVQKYPFDQLLATEIPSPHGQGLPGLLHLGYATFDFGIGNGFDDAFRAHEVAHQWWGNLVGWKTYHDQWLSEAFAEYFSGWYIQRKYMNNERHRGKFYELLDLWRDDVYQKGRFTKQGFMTDYQEGNDAGPIWMGYRLASSKSADYSTLVYSKGAYVLYMLRMMMFDFAKKDDSKFRTMLDDFLTEYRWSEASTADFQRIAEKHYGQSLDWFFDQWVYDVQLPEYFWEPKVKWNDDETYDVEVRVEVANVGEGFRMLVPFTILMEGDYHTTTRLDISELSQTITIPNLPHLPKKFLFNTFKSVLCKEKQK